MWMSSVWYSFGPQFFFCSCTVELSFKICKGPPWKKNKDSYREQPVFGRIFWIFIGFFPNIKQINLRPKISDVYTDPSLVLIHCCSMATSVLALLPTRVSFFLVFCSRCLDFPFSQGAEEPLIHIASMGWNSLFPPRSWVFSKANCLFPVG